MHCSTPGFPLLHYLPEFAQTRVLWVGDAIQPSHLLSSSSSAFNLSQHQGLFQLSWLFASCGQSVEVSASASVLPMNIEGWFPLVDPPLLSPLFSCEEATKLLSPEGCLPSATSVGPSCRSALELNIHTARAGDTSGPSEDAQSVAEGGLGKVAGWSCCGEGRHCSENHTHSGSRLATETCASQFRDSEDPSCPPWDWPFHLHVCLVCHAALRPSVCHPRGWLRSQL